MLCSFVDGYQYFRQTCCIHLYHSSFETNAFDKPAASTFIIHPLKQMHSSAKLHFCKQLKSFNYQQTYYNSNQLCGVDIPLNDCLICSHYCIVNTVVLRHCK